VVIYSGSITFVTVSFSVDCIDEFSELHATVQSEEVLLILNLNLEPLVRGLFEINPFTEDTFIGQNSTVNSGNFKRNLVCLFACLCLVKIVPLDTKDIGTVIVFSFTVENRHGHGEIWLSRVSNGVTDKFDGCGVFGEIWGCCYGIELRSNFSDGISIGSTHIQIGL